MFGYMNCSFLGECMNNDALPIASEISVTAPSWQVAIAAVAGLAGVAVAVWSALQEQAVGVVLGAVFCLLAAYVAIDALTTRIWISGEEVFLRDRVIRVRDFALEEVESVTFVPDELFEIHFAANRLVRFPAGAKGLDRLFERLVAYVDPENAHREYPC